MHAWAHTLVSSYPRLLSKRVPRPPKLFVKTAVVQSLMTAAVQSEHRTCLTLAPAVVEPRANFAWPKTRQFATHTYEIFEGLRPMSPKPEIFKPHVGKFRRPSTNLPLKTRQFTAHTYEICEGLRTILSKVLKWPLPPVAVRL